MTIVDTFLAVAANPAQVDEQTRRRIGIKNPRLFARASRVLVVCPRCLRLAQILSVAASADPQPRRTKGREIRVKDSMEA